MRHVFGAFGALLLTINGGNFCLVDCSMTQIARVPDINRMDRVTAAVVDATRERCQITPKDGAITAKITR